MSDKYDAFGDIINEQAGIFGSGSAGIESGLGAFDSAQTRTQPNGVVVHMQCRRCGGPVQLTFEYPELVCIKYNVQPQVALPNGRDARGQVIVRQPSEWYYSQNNQAWFPKEVHGCGELCGPLITPEEAESHLQRARQRGWIAPEGEKYINMIAAQAYAHQQAQRGRLGG